MEQVKDQCRDLGVGPEPEPFLKSPQIVECLVGDRQADDGVGDVGVDVPPAPHPPIAWWQSGRWLSGVRSYWTDWGYNSEEDFGLIAVTKERR
jgi:hypothetical protein